ncbi:hypothetical protein IAU60_006604 [Kwoniella sp. DSM 27419]
MRESNYTFPPQNRAVTNITHMIYDRRALDTNSSLALLNSLTSLTYLTSTSPRIREILTVDGGLERLLDILRDSCVPSEVGLQQDLWGLNGPPTARIITFDKASSLRHALTFQCVVNIGVRGSEEIRTRVVQAGALDLVAQILESWLKDHGVSIFAGSLGSQAAVDAVAAGLPVPGTEQIKQRDRERREWPDKPRFSSHRHNTHPPIPHPAPTLEDQSTSVSARAAELANQAASAFGWNLTLPTWADQPRPSPTPEGSQGDTDVDMADGEGGETDDASVDADDVSIDVDVQAGSAAPPSTTPRASTSFLPMAIPRAPAREPHSQTSSVGTSLSGDDGINLPRNTSDGNLAESGPSLRPPGLNLPHRVPQLAQDATSTQSSPVGTPVRGDSIDIPRPSGRRGTIIARPANLAPRNDRQREHTAGSGTDGGEEDIDLPTATIVANMAAAHALEGNTATRPEDTGPPPDVEIVETAAGHELDEPDPDQMAAEQARLDMEAGAPPGQPGAAQTPRVTPGEAPTPGQPAGATVAAAATTPEQAQIIIANGAPRGFQDLSSYVGISSLLNPEGNRYSNDSILLALQLLAYLSKYPHVRTAFHNPRRPMHQTFDLGLDEIANPLPQRPAYSETPDVFSLVERFTFRASPSDPLFPKIPTEIQYWAGVIMRNACRKDEAAGGIRQCANMTCGRWETYPREFAKCRRCRKAKYCSKECQSGAWQEGHRFWCSTRNDNEPGMPPVEGADMRPPSPAGDDEDPARSQWPPRGGDGTGHRSVVPPTQARWRPGPSREVNSVPAVDQATVDAHRADRTAPFPDFRSVGQPQHAADERSRRGARRDANLRGTTTATASHTTPSWQAFGNVGTFLGLRNGASRNSPVGGHDATIAAAATPPWHADGRAGPGPSRETRPTPTGEARRDSQQGVTGLGFNLSDHARRP